jgi:hypothetical protein
VRGGHPPLKVGCNRCVLSSPVEVLDPAATAVPLRPQLNAAQGFCVSVALVTVLKLVGPQ